MVLTVAELLPASESASAPVTLAVLVICPATVGVTLMVTTALAPFASVPRLQLTGPVPLQVPCVVEEETLVTLAGGVSVRLRWVAVAGPLFVMVILKESVVPPVAGLGEPVLTSEI